MSEIAVHKEQCQKLLDQPYTEVHQFLDQHNNSEDHPFTAHLHRSSLHHRQGLLTVSKRFGIRAILAARLHILEDCLGYMPENTDYSRGIVDEYGRPKDQSLMDTHWFEKELKLDP